MVGCSHRSCWLHLCLGNRSIFTFHRCLLRCVTKLFRVTTTGHRNKRKGYDKLEKHKHPQEKYNDKKRTIFLDLDETLIHSTMQPPRIKYDFMVRVTIEGEIIPIFVVKRPGVDDFLERIGEKYKVVIFTAGVQEYASPVLDKLDKNHVISQRLYRDSCKEMNGKYVKDLSLVVGKDLRSVVIVDDNPFAYLLQPENAVPVKPFVDDMKDQELKKLVEFFERCFRQFLSFFSRGRDDMGFFALKIDASSSALHFRKRVKL